MYATTHFKTESEDRYPGTLCKHFSHKVPVNYKSGFGRIDLSFGPCALTTQATRLTFTAAANDRSKLDKTIEVITSHLDRFAFR